MLLFHPYIFNMIGLVCAIVYWLMLGSFNEHFKISKSTKFNESILVFAFWGQAIMLAAFCIYIKDHLKLPIKEENEDPKP